MHLRNTSRLQASSRLSHTTDMGDAVRDADFISEAIVETIEIKREVIGKVCRLCSADAIVSTNTMSLSVSEIARGCTNPQRFVGQQSFCASFMGGIAHVL